MKSSRLGVGSLIRARQTSASRTVSDVLRFFLCPTSDQAIFRSEIAQRMGEPFHDIDQQRFLPLTGINIPTGADEGLPEAFNQNDHRAFKEVFDKLYGSVFGFACRFVREDVAADISADCFLKLWSGVKDFENLIAVKRHLQVVAKNACLNQIRRDKMIAVKTAEVTAVVEAYSQKDQRREIESMLLEKIYELIEKLPPGSRKIIQLAYIEGLKVKEIARRLNLSENTVFHQKTRALKALRIAVIGKFILAVVIFYLKIPLSG